MNTQPKKRGRPVGSKKAVNEKKKALHDSIEQQINRQTQELLALWPAKKYLEDEIEVPTLRRIREVPCIRYQGGKELCFCDDCILDEKPKMSLANKITIILTPVNVAILISLIVKNIWMK